MAFRSNSYTRLCSASGQQTEETTGKPQHTASVEHIDFRKAFDFADRCSREGSKSVEKLSAFKPVYVRRPVQALHSFDSLSASPDLSVDTPKMKSEPAISQCSKRNEHLEGTAGELQRVFDQLAAQLEQEANELRKEARERSPSLRQVGLLRANSDCGSSPARKIRTQDLDASLVTNENNTRLSDSSANTPHTSLKPPLSRGSVSPVHVKGGHRREDRRGSTGECNNSAWNKSSSSNKASYSLSSSPVRERFAARRRADSLERVRDVNKTGQDQDKDGEKVVVAQRRTQWDGARDMDTSIVSQRKLALERKSNVDVSVPSHRRPSFDKDGDTSLLFKRRASLERNVNSAGSPNRRSSSRERAEARLAALQKLSANREKFEDYVPRSQRNGKVTPKEICSRERSHSLRSNQQDASNADSQLTEFVDKRSLTPDYNERSPVHNDRYGAVEPSMSTNVELGDESLQNNRTEKFDEIKLQKVALSREISPSGDVYSGKAIHVKSGFSFSAEVESPPALRIELPPSGERQPPGSSLKAPHDKDDQYLFRPLSQDSDHRLHGVPANTEQGSSSTDFNVSIHSDPKSLNLPDRNSPSVQSSSNEPASSIADEVQTAASVHSQSLSSSTESLPSSNAEETAVDLDFPQVLDKVVTRYELERRLEQEATEGNPPLKEDKPNVCVRAEPVYTPVENTDRMQKIKVSNFFSDDNLSYKRDSAKCGNGIRTQTSAEPPKLSFVNPEMPGYVGFANLPNQVHRKSVKKGFEFTLMVVGESGLGKSTLINSLFMTDLYPERNIPSAAERIEKTVSIEASTVEIEERGVRLRLTVVDTPGYADSMNSTDCFKPIIKYVDDQFEKYLRDESGLNRKNIVDNRIHACFYFINPVGHGLKPLDIIFMKALHHKVNIVPVIAKADTLSKHEVARLKKKVLEEIEENGINIYALPDCDAEEDESYKQSCEELKAAVPFAVVGSNQVMDVGGRKVRARAYPWGVVEVENPDHCDFIKLRTMFITHMQDLQEVTHDVHYENFRSQRLASEPPKIRTSREVDSILSEQDRLLQERELKLRKMEEELQKVKEQMMKQQISVASENVEKKPVTHISTAINGQTNDKLTKKAPIVQMNQV